MIKFIRALGCENIIFSHEPVFIDSKNSLVNVHGHTHNSMVSEDYFIGEYNKNFPKEKVNPAQYINVCMDANNFTPINFLYLIKKLETREINNNF